MAMVSNSNSNNIGDVNIELCNNVPDLPFEIIVDIISRLHVKVIVACMSLSKAFKNLISDPSFSHMYHTNNKSNSFHTVFVDAKKRGCSFDLAEFDKRDIYNENGGCRICNTGIFNTKRFSGGRCSESRLFSVFGYCDGMFCLVISEFGVYNLFVINPLLGEFIKLPEPVVHVHDDTFFSFGIGYCQYSDRYKVLRIMTEYRDGGHSKSNSEIFTIGYDQNWRSLDIVNPPYDINRICTSIKPRLIMVPFLSALHWIVHPIYRYTTLEPIRMYICAFDMTKEKVSVLQLPFEVATHIIYGQLIVLLDKLCVWRERHFELWVMNEYGVEGSWTKQFVLKKSNLPTNIKHFSLAPFIILAEGVIVLSDRHKLVFYDMKKENCLRVFHQSTSVYYPVPFAPSFVSLRNLVQGPGLMIVVEPCSPAFKEV